MSSTSSFLPEGFAVRPATDADAEAAFEVAHAMDLSVQGFSEFTLDDLRRGWAHALGAWVVTASDGRVVGVAELSERGVPMADVFVHPGVWGRGVGTGLLHVAEAEARARGFRMLRNAVLGADEPAQRLLEAEGYRWVRAYCRMLIEMDAAPPAPEWPAGIEVSHFDPATEAREFHAALEEAFAEEWDYRPQTFEDWRARRLQGMPFDPILWWVARDGGEIAGLTVCDRKRFGMGWVGGLAVRKPWRRRGLGLALLRQTFGEFYRRGERAVGLAVDADNPTGAPRLYERAGMRVSWSAAFYEKELAC